MENIQNIGKFGKSYEDEDEENDCEEAYLIIFDFDGTIIDQNSDTVLWQLFEGGKISDELKNKYVEGKWTEFMNIVAKELNKIGVKEKDYIKYQKQCTLSQGFGDLLKFLQENKQKFHSIIISDSNNLYIKWILEQFGLQDLFVNIFTNFAYFNQEGALVITPHHNHQNPKCPVNLCKQTVMKKFINQQQFKGVNYKKVVYIGDGQNDYCPSTALQKQDHLFVRKGFGLEKNILLNQNEKKEIQSEITFYDSGLTILEYLKNLP